MSFIEVIDGHLIRVVKYVERVPTPEEREGERSDLLAGAEAIIQMIG